MGPEDTGRTADGESSGSIPERSAEDVSTPVCPAETQEVPQTGTAQSPDLLYPDSAPSSVRHMATTPEPIYPPLLGPAELERWNSREVPGGAGCRQGHTKRGSRVNYDDKGKEPIPPPIPNQVRISSKSSTATSQPGWAPQEHSDLGLRFELYLSFRLQFPGRPGTGSHAALTPTAQIISLHMTASAVPAAERPSQRAHLPSLLAETVGTDMMPGFTARCRHPPRQHQTKGRATAELHVLPASLREKPHWYPIPHPLLTARTIPPPST